MKKLLLSLALVLAVVPWGLAFGPLPALAKGEGATCTAHSDCDWPLSCRNSKCARVSGFRIVPECATARSSVPGQAPPVPTLTCMLQTFGNIAQLILGLTGSAALLMFVYGGFLMVTSAGSQEKVSKGKTVMTNAVIGIFIIMTSGLLIQYGLSKIGVSSGYQVVGQECGGVMVQLPDGTNKCVTGCAQLGSKFSCGDVKTTHAGKYCIASLCQEAADATNKDKMCCYTP